MCVCDTVTSLTATDSYRALRLIIYKLARPLVRDVTRLGLGVGAAPPPKDVAAPSSWNWGALLLRVGEDRGGEGRGGKGEGKRGQGMGGEWSERGRRGEEKVAGEGRGKERKGKEGAEASPK